MEFDKFEINIEGLKLGKHEFKFLVDKSFFEELEYSEINEGNVVVDLVLTKSERLFQLEFYFEGNVTIPCDRCGDDLTIDIDVEEQAILKFGEEPSTDSDMIVIEQNATDFDSTHYIYESILLALPFKKVHTEYGQECNEKALEYLSQQNNSDNDDDMDPRWSELLKLK